MDITDELEEISLFFDQNGFKTPSEKWAVSLVVAIKTLGINAIDVSHDAAQITERRLDQEVIVIVH
jgi:hypothetical protein